MAPREGMPDLPADADAAFDDHGRLKVDAGKLASGLGEPAAEPLPATTPLPAREAPSEPRTAPPPDEITPGPAPTGEETAAAPAEPPLVLDLNMNKVKMRELRGVERILLAVYGRPYPVMPALEDLPADLTIALLAHKKLLHEGIDATRMTEEDALRQAPALRDAFAWAEEIDFADLSQPAPGAGEGNEPADPTNAVVGNGHGPSASATSTSGQRS